MTLHLSLADIWLRDESGKSVLKANFDKHPVRKQVKKFCNNITSLSIDYSDVNEIVTDKRYDISSAIFGNCLNAIKTVELLSCTKDSLSLHYEPFRNASQIKIAHCNLDEWSTRFDVWFPNMQSLHLDRNTYLNLQCIEQSYEKLNSLYVRTNNQPRQLTKSNLIRIIRKNPNLIDLHIDFVSSTVDAELLHLINEHLKGLELLHVNIDDINSFQFRGNDYDFANLKSLKVRIDNSLNIAKCPFNCKQLEAFELFEWSPHNSSWNEFICQNAGLRRLCLWPVTIYQFTVSTFLLKFARDLPQLHQMCTAGEYIDSEDTLIQLFEANKTLKEVQLSFERGERAYIQRLERMSRGNWLISRNQSSQDQKSQVIIKRFCMPELNCFDGAFKCSN